MVVKECNTHELEALMNKHPNAIFYRVCRAPIFVKGMRNAGAGKYGNQLSPNRELHDAYQHGKITWEEYKPAFITQIETDPKAQELLREIKIISDINMVFLVCVCGRDKGTECHRFLLKDMISH